MMNRLEGSSLYFKVVWREDASYLELHLKMRLRVTVKPVYKNLQTTGTGSAR